MFSHWWIVPQGLPEDNNDVDWGRRLSTGACTSLSDQVFEGALRVAVSCPILSGGLFTRSSAPARGFDDRHGVVAVRRVHGLGGWVDRGVPGSTAHRLVRASRRSCAVHERTKMHNGQPPAVHPARSLRERCPEIDRTVILVEHARQPRRKRRRDSAANMLDCFAVPIRLRAKSNHRSRDSHLGGDWVNLSRDLTNVHCLPPC